MQNFKFSMMALCFMLFSTVAIAQGPKKAGEKQAAQIEKMATDLKLTPEQKASFIQFSTDQQKVQSQKMKAATTDEEKKAARKVIRDEYNSKLDATFGKELADKMRTWTKENAANSPKKKAPQAAE